MDILVVVLFIAIAIILFLIEVFLIPGISIAGIIGAAFGIGGVVYAFMVVGVKAGIITLAVGLVLFSLFTYLIIKGKVLDKLSLQKSLEETEVFNDASALSVGQCGKTLSRLAPMGKIVVDGKIYEARCLDALVDPGTDVEITNIEGTSITVKVVKP